ncbi:MAG: DMT family transporter [Sarcina sp.]
MTNKNKAILLMILSSLTAALASTTIKMAGNIPFYEQSFFRNIVTIIITLFIIMKNKGSLFGLKENRKYLFFRALCGTFAVWCSYYAIDHMLLANATVLSKISPFFALIFSYVFLKEKLKIHHIVAMIIAFIGVILVVKPTTEMALATSIIAILSGVLGGGVSTLLRFLRNREKANTIVFFYAFTSAILSIPLMIYSFKTPTLSQLLILLLSGVFSSGTQFALTTAYRYAPAKEISVFSYSNIIFVTIIGALIWNTIPSELALGGYVLIIGAAILMFIYNKKLA